MRSTRERLAVLAAAFAVVATAWAANRVAVEDWRSYPVGTRGVPGDWKGQNWGQPAYDLEIVADNGQPVLRLRSKGETSTISRDLRGSVDLDETPILEWSWKGYVWDSTAPVGTTCKSQKAPTVTYVVVRSGADELGKWITERRNVVEDFRRIYGEAPDKPNALALSIDSDDTRSSAESFIGPIAFMRP